MLPVFQNWLLRALVEEDRRALLPPLKRRHFGPGERLEQPDQPIKSALFPEAGVISVEASDKSRLDVRVGMIGRDGVIGTAAFHDVEFCRLPMTVLLPGWGYEIAVADFTEICKRRPAIASLMNRYSDWRLVQTAALMLVKSRAGIEKGLAHLLLMLHDRISSDDIPIVHDQLARMLGVRRPGVTAALHVLEGNHLVRSTRGMLRIVHRTKLEQFARPFYGRAEIAYQDDLEIGAVLPGTDDVQAAMTAIQSLRQ